MRRSRVMKVYIPLLAVLLNTPALCQVDPGPRGGTPGAGQALANVDLGFFNAAKRAFEEVDTVANGLGPRFNMNSCAGCHAQPVTGGSSPKTNPQVAVAILDGAKNKVPGFITINGPVREARFVHKPDGTLDGGVYDLFVITGRWDAPGCHIAQPDFASAIASNNIIFRIPTPVFGAGLVEATPDNNLVNAFNSQIKFPGIAGHFNTSGNDGTITKFGWKAQNKSLLIFAGEAYNVEQGVTNELFPNERDSTPSCQLNGTPEDHTNVTSVKNILSTTSSDITNFAAFMRMLAAPVPATISMITTVRNIASGRQIFNQTGCNGCHIDTQTTGKMSLTGQQNVDYHPFSDFAVHDMGQALADGVAQGNANGNEFRTAPLWGLGQRLFFLHDGRTGDLVQAIEAHASPGSEANVVINNYNHLSPSAKQSLLNYLRSL